MLSRAGPQRRPCNLGNYYVERVYKLTLETYFGKSSRWTPDQFPEQVKPWMLRIKDGDVLTRAEKQEALSAWYEDLNKGPESGLPKAFRSSFRKSKTGFTEDVMNQSLLDGPPEGIG